MAGAGRRGTLAFGVVIDDPSRRVWLKTACDVLGRRLGTIVFPQWASSYEALVEGLTAGTVDFAWTPPLVAAVLVQRRKAQPVVCSRRGNASHYRAVLFARKDSGLLTPAKLCERHIAWVDRNSASGYVVPRMWLRDNGFDPDGMFKRESFLGTHGAVARAVLRGWADAGATFALFGAGPDAIVQAGWMEAEPKAADDVHVVANVGVVPSDCISVTTRLDSRDRQRIANAFLELDAAALESFRVALGTEGYEAAAPDHARALERLLLGVARRASLVPPA